MNNKTYAPYLSTEVYRSAASDAGNKTFYATACLFELPKAYRNALDNLKQAFQKEKAISGELRFYATDDGKKYQLTYGRGGRLSYIVGDDFDHFIIFTLQDAPKSKIRTAWVLEWDNDDDELEGRLIKVYGEKIQPSAQRKVWKFDGDALLSDSLSSELDSIRKTIQKALREKLPSQKDWKSFGGRFKGRMKDIFSGKSDINVYNIDRASSPTDFLVKFSTLLSSYRNALREKKELNTRLGLANKLLRLCDDAPDGLKARQFKLCIQQLKDLRNEERDRQLKGLIQECSDELVDEMD